MTRGRREVVPPPKGDFSEGNAFYLIGMEGVVLKQGRRLRGGSALKAG